MYGAIQGADVKQYMSVFEERGIVLTSISETDITYVLAKAHTLVSHELMIRTFLQITNM